MSLVVSLAVLVVSAPASVQTSVEADVWVDGRTQFTLTKTHELGPDGEAVIRSVYRDLKGAEVLIMHAELRHGRPVRVTAHQRQTHVAGTVRMGPGRVDFELISAKGEVQRDHAQVLGVVMVGPALTPYLQSDEAWKRLVRGEAVRVQIAAWERMSTYEFEFKRADSSSPEQLIVLMRPTTWLVRAFVEEMRYTFDLGTRRLLRYRGPVGLKRMSKDGGATGLSAEVVYRSEPAAHGRPD